MTSFDWSTFWPKLWDFLINGWPLQVLIIIVIAVIVRIALHFVIRRAVDRIVNGVKKRQNVDDTRALQASPLAAVRTVQRTRTLGAVLSNVVTVVIVIVALISIVTSINSNITGAFSLITAALGAGLGFGAQNVVKDVLNGLFMVVEDQLGVGDVVDVSFATGVVETVGIRTTQIRDVNGVLWFVRNGEILRVGNMSQGWSRVIIDLAVPYDADVQQVQERMLSTAVDMAAEPKWKRIFLERPEVWGIESISAEAIVIRIVAKTRSGSKDDVARDLRGRLLYALDDMNVKLPSLNTVVLSGFDDAASVRGARPPSTAPIAAQQPPAPAKRPLRRPKPPVGED
jgi:moderate conductance mechanosensitive channel